MWAADVHGIEPDVILTAKGLGSGMPIGAIIAKESVMTWPRGSHGSTYGGNPVACASALATLELVENELAANAAKMGARLLAGLKKLQDKHECIGDVRGEGMLLGVELVRDRESRQPFHELGAMTTKRCFELGLSMNIRRRPERGSADDLRRRSHGLDPRQVLRAP